MLLKEHYIRSSLLREELGAPSPAPYMRRSFFLDEIPEAASIRVSAPGFYRIWVNGKEITKGYLAPYIASPDDFLVCDEYDLVPYLRAGKNTVAFLLGNGIMNCFGGYVWDFDKAPWRDAPILAFAISLGETVIVSDSETRTHPSPLTSNDLRLGEDYDARLRIPDWNLPELDDSAWTPAISARAPRGSEVMASAEPIKAFASLSPISVTALGGGYLYDFGENNAGILRLSVKGERGQRITVHTAEWLNEDGTLMTDNLHFCHRPEYADKPHYGQRIVFICSGGEDTYEPSFTYFGFRYAFVEGINPEQAKPELLTYRILHSALPAVGGFTSSDPVISALWEMTVRSDESNFYYFPTDCPQREKNGWTADAALSAEQLLLKYDASKSYRAWLGGIRRAMREIGDLPGIVPTSDWGWGEGPAWDYVLFELPYMLWRYRGDTEVIAENAAAMMRYLVFLVGKRDADGLINFGLGDWCAPPPMRAPLAVTGSIVSYDLSRKASEMLAAIGMAREAECAASVARDFRDAIRAHLIDFETATVKGACQTSQAMAIAYGIFAPCETEKAFRVLLETIESDGEQPTVGVLGARVLYRVLSEYGESELAYRMVTRADSPSYGYWVSIGLTTLAESMRKRSHSKGFNTSLNHHFWGDISGWFTSCLAGIRYNPDADDIRRADIRPAFPSAMRDASAYYDSPIGRISSAWRRISDTELELTVCAPHEAKGTISLDSGYSFDSACTELPLRNGTYKITKKKA